jgi:ribA/ribD-fused uncharacterized protein
MENKGVGRQRQLDWNKSGSNGLVPTIVQSQHDGRVLGLVYSSRESLDASIAKRRGIFQSRRRSGTLWDKSPSRRNSLRLSRVEHDCDADALLFTVQERGHFCHVPGQRTCFSCAQLVPHSNVLFESKEPRVRIGYCLGRQEEAALTFLSHLGLDVRKHYDSRDASVSIDYRNPLLPMVDLVPCKPRDMQSLVERGEIDMVLCYQDNVCLVKSAKLSEAWQCWTSPPPVLVLTGAATTENTQAVKQRSIRLVAVKKRGRLLPAKPIVYCESLPIWFDDVRKFMADRGWPTDDQHFVPRHGSSEGRVRNGQADVAFVVVESGKSIQVNELEIVGQVYTAEFAAHVSVASYRDKSNARFYRAVKGALDPSSLYFYSVDCPVGGFLSNLFPSPFTDARTSLRWPTVEHYYQAHKFVLIPTDVERIRTQPTPWDAYRLAYQIGSGVFLEPLQDKSEQCESKADFDANKSHSSQQPMKWWLDNRDQVMRDALRLKFDQNADLRDMLVSTYPKRLVEHALRDRHFGCGHDGQGENVLGDMLMALRSLYMLEGDRACVPRMIKSKL